MLESCAARTCEMNLFNFSVTAYQLEFIMELCFSKAT